MSRSKLILAAFAVSLSVAVVASARAEIFSFSKTDTLSGSGLGSKTYVLNITDPAIYTATLIDLGFPDTFQLLELGVAKTGSGPLLGSTAVPGSFQFVASTTGSYTLLLFGEPGTPPGGSFSINVAQFAPIPEPGIWFLIASGIGLIGFLKLRKENGLQRNASVAM